MAVGPRDLHREYSYLRGNTPVTLTSPKIVDAPLTLILRMGLLLCCCLFCLYWLPIHLLWITANK
jgi:hypothetical protein